MNAPRIEGLSGEVARLLRRIVVPGRADEGLSYEANDWLMETMRRETSRKTVTAVHSYEDCSLLQFREARSLGKACIYDMPIGYYRAWQQTYAELSRRYPDWLPPGDQASSRYERPEQKREEMELADLVLAPSGFVRDTIQRFVDKEVVVAPYGADLQFWRPAERQRAPKDGPLRFVFAGQCSIRKGVPVLLNAWRKAALKDAVLELVGLWRFAPERKRDLPPGVRYTDPMSAESLKAKYNESDIFVLPSFFEGMALALLEAAACGLPVIATERTGAADLLTPDSGRVLPAGDEDALTETLRWFSNHRDELPSMKAAARQTAERWTWSRYRTSVSAMVAPLV